MHTVGVEIGFNQSEVTTTEGSSTVAVCAEVTSGELEREITAYLRTANPDTLPGIQSGEPLTHLSSRKQAPMTMHIMTFLM